MHLYRHAHFVYNCTLQSNCVVVFCVYEHLYSSTDRICKKFNETTTIKKEKSKHRNTQQRTIAADSRF